MYLIYDDVVLNEEYFQRNFSSDVLPVDLTVKENYNDFQLLADFLNDENYFDEIYHYEWCLLLEALTQRLIALLKEVIKLKVNTF
jgi:hypothetical protein